jgi:hypothetical protein
MDSGRIPWIPNCSRAFWLPHPHDLLRKSLIGFTELKLDLGSQVFSVGSYPVHLIRYFR